MKFTAPEDASYAIHEYKMYIHLNAITNPNIEHYGTPGVYYYGQWNDFVLMAITSLDNDFERKWKRRQVNEVDILIIFREFVSLVPIIFSPDQNYNIMSFFIFFKVENNKIYSW